MLQIHYFLALPVTEEIQMSPFQGFSVALFRRNMIFRQIAATLPPSVLELFNPSVQSFQQRYAGMIPYSVGALDATEFKNLRPELFSPFMTVFTDSETIQHVRKWAQQWPYPVWQIDLGSPLETVLTKSNLKLHCKVVLESLRRSDPKHPILEISDLTVDPDPCDVFSVPIRVWHHNTTVPNEVAMLSVGAQEGTVEKPLVGENEIYVKAIVETAQYVLRLREVVPESSLYEYSPAIYSLILTSPGRIRFTQKMDRPRDLSSRQLRDAVRILETQQTYATTSKGDGLNAFLENPAAAPAMFLRTNELNIITSALCVRAAAFLSPVLRLPPSINHVLPSVVRLTDCLRGFRPKLSKIRQAAKELFDDIESRVDARFIELIDSPHSHVKIISDAPLEWLPIRGIPLMLRKTTSRIPVTPGNLAFQNILPVSPLRLSMRNFKETLVIRSFPIDDPIEKHLETAIDGYRLPNGDRLPVRIVDVRTRLDVVNALNSFNGALVVFDCHGSHRKGDNEIAALHLAEEKFDVWGIRLAARIPPIVFTCACDTHSIGRSHVTTGNGLLYCGARTVIASVVPVSAAEAAIFAARLLFRIYQLLPSVTGETLGWTVRWDGVISLLQRMMFVSELFNVIRHHQKFDWDWGLNSESECVSIIHNSGSEWYERVVEELARDARLTTEGVETIRNQLLPFPNTLKYLQMGNPEMILIGPDDGEEAPTE